MRQEFSKPTKRAARKRSGRICECHRLHVAGIPGFRAEGCGQPLGAGNIFYEHVLPDNIEPHPTLENCAVLTKTCWKLKTKYDLSLIAKNNRVRDRDWGIKRGGSHPMPGSRQSKWKKKVSGEVVLR